MIDLKRVGLSYPHANFQQEQLNAAVEGVQPFRAMKAMGIFENRTHTKRQATARKSISARMGANFAKKLFGGA